MQLKAIVKEKAKARAKVLTLATRYAISGKTRDHALLVNIAVTHTIIHHACHLEARVKEKENQKERGAVKPLHLHGIHLEHLEEHAKCVHIGKHEVAGTPLDHVTLNTRIQLADRHALVPEKEIYRLPENLDVSRQGGGPGFRVGLDPPHLEP
jgi:hypothetical protein